LLQLAFVTPLFLLALFLDGAAVVLQGIPRVGVFVFQRADLLIFIVEAQLVIAARLAESGIAGLLGLQAGAGGLQGCAFFRQGSGLNIELLLKLLMGVLQGLQLGVQGSFLLFELRQGQVDRLLSLVFEALGQPRDQLAQFFVDGRLGDGDA